jgi:hypothetical protein
MISILYIYSFNLEKPDDSGGEWLLQESRSQKKQNRKATNSSTNSAAPVQILVFHNQSNKTSRNQNKPKSKVVNSSNNSAAPVQTSVAFQKQSSSKLTGQKLEFSRLSPSN